jgi:hypothetical protein
MPRFEASTRIAAGNELDIALDLEAIHLGKLEETKRP